MAILGLPFTAVTGSYSKRRLDRGDPFHEPRRRNSSSRIPLPKDLAAS
jgi:hypothetical protein